MYATRELAAHAGEYDAKRVAFKQGRVQSGAIAGTSSTPRLHSAIALIYDQQAQSPAERQFQRAVQADPKNGPALLSLAVIQAGAGKTDQADETYTRLSALPDSQYKPYHAA